MESQGSCLLLSGLATDTQPGAPTRRKSTTAGGALLSPNEEMQLAREELDRRRKLRLQQVREQQRYLAVCVRKQVAGRRRQQESQLEQQLRQEWTQQQQQSQDTLTTQLTHTLTTLGHAHASAKENEPDWAGLVQKRAEQKERAVQRHAHALKELKIHTHSQEQRRTRHIRARQRALDVEKERAATVAHLPPPPADPIECVLESGQQPQKKLVALEQFSSSQHHLPGTTVETHTLQADAKAAAEEEARRLGELHQEVTRDRVEQLEKARLRGEHALKKEHMTQERRRMLYDLERMQAADWLRRRQALHQAPPSRNTHALASSHTHTHTHTHGLADERQRMLEHAFQDLYTDERRVKGDLVLQLMPEPLPAPSTSSHGNDLDLTLESEVTPVEEEQEPPADLPSQSHGLRRLLERIRSQREHWNTRSVSTTSSSGQLAAPMATQHSQDAVPMATQHSHHAAPMATQHSHHAAPMATQHSHHAAPMATQHSHHAAPMATQHSHHAAPMATQHSDGTAPMATQHSHHAAPMATQHSHHAAPMATQHSHHAAPMATQHSDGTAPMATQHSDGTAPMATQHSEEDVGLNGMSIETGSLTGLRAESVLPVVQEWSLEHRPQEEEETRQQQESTSQAYTLEDSNVLRIQQYQQHLLEQSRRHKQCVEEARRRLEEYQRTLTLRHHTLTRPASASSSQPSTVPTATPPPAAVPTATPPPAAVPTATPPPAAVPTATAPPTAVPMAATSSHDAHTLPHMHADTHTSHSCEDTHTSPLVTHTPAVDASPSCLAPPLILSHTPALPQVLSGPAHMEGEESVDMALPHPALVLQDCNPVQAERFSLMSALLRAIQDSSQSTNQDAWSSRLANQDAWSSRLANQDAWSSRLANQDAWSSRLANPSASSPQATSYSTLSAQLANHSTQNAPSVPPLASAVASHSSALHDWHQLSAILEVDTPLNSTVPEESMFHVDEAPCLSESSSVSLSWPTHTRSHTHTEESGSPGMHTHTHTGAHTHSGPTSRLSWRDTLRLHSTPPTTVAAPGSTRYPHQTPETEFLSPVDPGTFTTTISTGSYCTSSTGTDPSLSADAGPGVGVVSPVVSSNGMATEHWLPSSRAEDIIERHQLELMRLLSGPESIAGLSSWAQVLQNEPDVQEPAALGEAPGDACSPGAEYSILQSSVSFLPLHPETDSSPSSYGSTHTRTDQQWDDSLNRIVGQFSCLATSNQSDLGVPHQASTSNQSDLSLPHHTSTSNQSELSLPHQASTSNQSELSLPHHTSTSNQSELSQLIGQLSSQSSPSASGRELVGRGSADSAHRLIGQISEGPPFYENIREELRMRQRIGQTPGQEAGNWLAETWDSSLLIGQGPTFQAGPPVDLQQSSDSFHPLEAELTLGHLSVDAEDDPSLLRADSSQQAVQQSLFQTSLSLNPLQLSISGLHDNPSPQVKLALPASPTHRKHLLSQSEEGTEIMPLWDRILDLDCGRGILEESMLSLVSVSDVTLSSFHGDEINEGKETPRNASPTHTPHTHATHTLESSGKDTDTHISHTHTQEEEEQEMVDTPTSHTHHTHKQSGGENQIRAQVCFYPTQVLLSNPENKDSPELSLQAGEGVLKRVGEVKISPEHKNRLHNQLEEVRQRKEMHRRQATSIVNRQRAREFQQKTLQKLRAKPTQSAEH
ncbi:centrosomal protein 295 isoform X2 [Alosa pseudoharengus]|uniref:centrosomal protein 295 isoform X2 n=1 Tax=Alosa pseudoharengus TaxID=34774 RepID=UPI003F8CE3FD